MQSRRKISFATLLIIGIILGFVIKKVKIGLIIGIVLGLVAMMFIRDERKD
jgi:uncharacterized membrane protein (UPF0136 family)